MCTLNKYSNKIIYFIDEILNDNQDSTIHNINNFVTTCGEYNIFSQLTKIIEDTSKIVPDILIQIKNKYHISKVHDIKEYPMMYILFVKLYEKDIIDKLFTLKYNFSEFIYNFKKFILWFNTHSNELNIKLIHTLVNKYLININNSDKDDLGQIYSAIYNIEGHRKDLHQMLYNNKFVPIDVQHCAESFDMDKYVINCDDFNLMIYSDYQNELTQDDYINTIIKYIIHIINIMKSIGKNINNVTKPNILILLGTQKKQINNYDKMLSPTNINSGSSMGGINVMIWRKEEICKVLIHELIHFYEIDFNIFDKGYTEINEFLLKKYNIEFINCPNEAWTECFAVLIHCYFISFYTKNTPNKILTYEMIFTLFQISKILSFYGITSYNEIGIKKIAQTTSVFSYFIVKGALLFNLKYLIEKIDDDIKNILIKNKVDMFSSIVKQSLNESYFERVDEMLNIFKNIKHIRNTDFIMKTMRMTCFQI